jgi:hypothetical protein
MSQHALAVVTGFVCAALGIWIAGSLLGRTTDPVALMMWSLGIGIASAFVLAVFKSKDT